jgi:broad specificity phosphatase PhoE
MRKDFHLIRHGQSLANAGVDDHFDTPLSPLGRAQAGRCGEFMACLLNHEETRILASPFRRAVQTADLVAAASGLRVHLEPALHELFLAGWFTPGNVPLLPLPDLAEDYPRIIGRYPPGPWWPDAAETAEDIVRRATGLRNRLLGKEFPEASIVCVSHYGFISALSEVLCPGIALENIANASVTHLRWDGERCTCLLREEQRFLA